jgi:hypothetical protein
MAQERSSRSVDQMRTLGGFGIPSFTPCRMGRIIQPAFGGRKAMTNRPCACDSIALERRLRAPKGHYDSAWGFNPQEAAPSGSALKGSQNKA